MNDPKPPHRVQVEWPPVAVPGQLRLPSSGDRAPDRAGDRADRPAISGTETGHLSLTGTGDRPRQDGDGPREEDGPARPGAGYQAAASPEKAQVGGSGTGTDSGTGRTTARRNSAASGPRTQKQQDDTPRSA
ncbi:hypothetical protein TPA0909_41540 [Streptomyces albus]|nr:hypothetical protein TPA0909_41540 [Streptomyces albus]